MRGLLYSLFLFATLSTYAQNRKFPYSDGSKWGLTNENKEVLIAPKYDTTFWIYEGMAVVRKDKLYGAITADGKPLLPCRYEALSLLTKETGMAKLAGKYRLVNLSTGKLSTVLFDKLLNYRYNDPRILLVTEGGKWYFLNIATGRFINPKGYDEAGFVTGDHYQGMVKKGELYGVIDLKTGSVIAPVKYDHLVYKNDGEIEAIAGDTIISYTADGKARLVSSTGLTATEHVSSFVEQPPIFEDDYFSPGVDLYVYKTGDKTWKAAYEYRTRENVPGEQLPPAYELNGYDSVAKFYYSPSSNPKALLKVGKYGKFGLVTLENSQVLPCVYDDIENNGDFYKTIQDKLEGVISTDLKQLRPPVLKHIFEGDSQINAWYIEMPDGKQGFMDMKNGKIFIPGVKD